MIKMAILPTIGSTIGNIWSMFIPSAMIYLMRVARERLSTMFLEHKVGVSLISVLVIVSPILMKANGTVEISLTS